MENYSFYVVDTETSSLEIDCAILEASIYRLGDTGEEAQKTWFLKPFENDRIDNAALRVNGHKIEDFMHRTKEGREKYIDPHQAIIEMENFLSQDNLPAEKRCIIAHNTSFDKDRLEQLWIKCGSKDSWPFSRRYLDTMIIELAMDFAKGEFAQGYSLAALAKKYGVVNKKAHTATEDVLATKAIFEKQIEFLQKLMKNG